MFGVVRKECLSEVEHPNDAQDQLGGIGDVLCRGGVMNRLGRVAVRSVPRARPTMQHAGMLGLGECELMA